MNEATYALMESNIVREAGDIGAVERWCREAGVLAETEVVVEIP